MRGIRPAVLGLALLAGCGGAPPDGPPVLRLGESVCDECRMIVVEARYAASRRDGDGTARLFDDVGCLVRYRVGRPDESGVWVAGDTDGGWLAADGAFFVVSAGVSTPMGSGIVAHGSRDEAQAAAGEGGRVLALDELAAVLDRLDRDMKPIESERESQR